MKNAFSRKIFLICLLFLMLFSVMVSGCSNAVANAEAADSVTERELESEYFIGQDIVIPSAELIIDGSNIPANTNIFLPDGTVKVANRLTVDQAGRYAVRYEVKKDGKTYFDLKTFNVYKPLYEIVGNGNAEYGIEPKYDNAKGVKLSLTEDSVFKLNKKVNFEDLGNEIPFIKFRINPEREGLAELDNIFIKVTDANAPNNFFALKIRYLSTRLTASENAHVFGYINNLTTVYSGSIVCPPQQAEWSGQVLKASFVGDTSIGELKDQFISFYYNPIKQEVLGEDLTGNKNTVLSLSSFGDEWKGFTGNDVYIEVYGDNFRTTNAHLFIDSIGDIDLNVNKFLDIDAPEITIDYGDVDPDNCPKGYVGCNYPIFNATAFDYNEGVKPVVKTVYYNYYSESKVNIKVVDGRFSPVRAGVYTIVYVATDNFGNTAEQYIDIDIDDSANAPSFNCNASGSYTTNCTVGDKVDLADVVVTGYEHNYTVTIEITKEGKLFDFDASNDKFTVLELGTYTVKYIVYDFIGRKCEFSYTLIADINDKPFFAEDIENIVADKFIVGYEYMLPDIKAMFVSSDNVKIEVPVTISTNNGTVENGCFTPASAGNITFNIRATYNGKMFEKQVIRQAYSIKNASGIDFKSMFISSGNVIPCYSESEYAEYKVTGNGKIEFLNTVLAENAFVKIQTDKSYKEVSEIIFRLFNPYDYDRKLEVRLKSFDGSVFVSVNGQEFKTVVGGDFSGDNAFEIRYIDSQSEVNINGISYATNDENRGLGADYVSLEIEIVGKTASSVYGLIVEKVGNQTLKENITVDNQKPIIVCVGDFSGTYPIGSKYVSPVVLAKDIISPELKSFKMTVLDPNGLPVSVNGVEINGVDVRQIEIELTSYGAYFLEYQAIDESGRKESFGFAVNVPDMVAPTVNTKGSFAVSGEVGKAIHVAEFVATDNVDAAETLSKRVLIMDPNHNFKIVGKMFTPEKAGKYTVYCYVTDSFGNVGLCFYNIEVK